MIVGSTAIHPYNLDLLILRGISSSGQYGHSNKQCAISAFDTNCLQSADEGMAIILHLARNMEEDLPLCVDFVIAPPCAHASVVFAFLADGRGPSRGRHHGTRSGRGGRGPLPNKCSACGGMDCILTTCRTSNDALLKWTLAKRRMIVQNTARQADLSLTMPY
jgi:hypothetical protein